MNTHNLLSIPLALSLCGISAAQTVDPYFDPSAGSTVNTIVVQEDRDILVGGLFTTMGGISQFRLARLDFSGYLDAAFQPNPSNTVNALATQLDGKIIAAGIFATIGGLSRPAIARLNPDGTSDPSFNVSPNALINAVAIQPDGRILIGGAFTSIGGQPRNRIARLNADGSLDASFNPDASGTVNAFVLQPDGRILVGGIFSTIGGQTRSQIARLNADGSVDMSFNPGANSTVQCFAVQPDGKVLVGGLFSVLGGQTRNKIARLNTDGSLDSAFNPDSSGQLFTISLQADGRILIGGQFTRVGTETRFGIARLNADGGVDPTFFDPQCDAIVRCFAIQPDGGILVGGSFNTIGGTSRTKVARLNDVAGNQSLTVTGTSQIDWQRSGTLPEVEQVVFDFWNGSSWSPQVTADRVVGGWRMSGLSLPASTWVRARGRAIGGQYTGSSWITGQISAYGSGVLPDIAVKDGALNNLTSQEGRTTIHSANIGTPGTHTFTIRNTGAAALENLAASVNGRDAARFSLGTLGATSLPPGSETTLTVTFTPDSANAARAFLEIASNDLDETPFVVNLGGALAPEIAVEQPPGTDLGSGGGSNFGVVTLGTPLARTYTIRNTGALALDLGTITVTGTHASDFALDLTGTAASVASGGQTTLQVTFTPSAGGVRNAVLTLPNNDPDENPFVLNLSGTGNTLPVFSGYSVSTAYQTVVTISLGKLLTAASDADGHALSVTAAGPASAQGGTAVLGSGIIYTPPAAFSGTDSFPVTLTDALGATVNGTVTVTVGAAPGGGGGSTLNPPQVTVQPNGKPKITFQGIPGRSYRVERSTNMTSWSNLANVTASPTGSVEYIDDNPPSGSAFYRIARP